MSAEPFVTVAHLASAGELVAAKKFGEAEGEILRALSASPADAKALTLLALVRYKLGRLEDAHATYRELAGAAPHDAGARRNLGLLALKLERIDEALPDLEMAVRIAPGDARAWSYLGYAYAKKGEVVQAAAAFRRAGQDALANELDQAAKVQRPPTPVSRGSLGSGSLGRPVALAPPLPPMPTAAAERRPSSWNEPGARRPEDPAPSRAEAAAHAVPNGRDAGASADTVDPLSRARSSRCRCCRSCWRGWAGAVAVDPARRASVGDRRRGPRAGRRHPGRLGHAQVGAGRPAGAGADQHRADGPGGWGVVLSPHRWRRDSDRRRHQPLAAVAAGRRRTLCPRGSRAGVRGLADLGGGRGSEHGAAHAAVSRPRHGGAGAADRRHRHQGHRREADAPLGGPPLRLGRAAWCRTGPGCRARLRSSSAVRARAWCCWRRFTR